MPLYSLLACILFAGYSLAQITCDSPNITAATSVCGGVLYNFSNIVNPGDGSHQFKAASSDGYTYLFDMVGGLPPAQPACTFSPPDTGNAGGQSVGGSCFCIGKVAAQNNWILQPGSPQVITIQFDGGDDGRMMELTATCDPTTTGAFSATGETHPGSKLYEVDVRTCAACAAGCSAPPPPPPPPPPPQVTCDPPNVATATSICNGVTYNLGQMTNPYDGSYQFIGPAPDGFTYLFNMVGGLPTAQPRCIFPPGAAEGNAVGQEDIAQNACHSAGKVANQGNWILTPEAPGSPQTLTVVFSGGEDFRSSTLVVVCDPSQRANFTAQGETSPGSLLYGFTIQSCAACPQGCTTPPPPPPPPPPPSIPCTQVGPAAANCQGMVYNFSGLVDSKGSPNFVAPGSDKFYNYYFNIQGLPPKQQGCDFGQTTSSYIAGQGPLGTGDTCIPLGNVSQPQLWEVYPAAKTDPQVITVSFAGGLEDRWTTLTLVCLEGNATTVYSPHGETVPGSFVYDIIIETCLACPTPYYCGPAPAPPPPPPPQVTCDPPNVATATSVCDGVTYNLGQMTNPDDGSYQFLGSAPDGFTYLFNMVGGLPSAQPRCIFPPAVAEGNAVGQEDVAQNTCHSGGKVANQGNWILTPETSGSPQTLTVIFSGGEDFRSTTLVVVCDPTQRANFTAQGETSPGSLLYGLTIQSCAACLQGCATPPPPPPPPPPPSLPCTQTGAAAANCGGAVYDFSGLVDANGSPNFKAEGIDHMYNYYFNIQGLPAKQPGCDFGQSTDRYIAGQGPLGGGDTCVPLGSVSQPQLWEVYPATENGPQVISVSFAGGMEDRWTTLTMVCLPNNLTTKYLPHGETVPGSFVYDIILLTCLACPAPYYCGPQPSPSPSGSTPAPVGWILIGLFFGGLFIYFVGGMLLLHYKHGLSGREMVPHADFWTSLPGLVRDGFIFTFNKCGRRGSSGESYNTL